MNVQITGYLKECTYWQFSITNYYKYILRYTEYIVQYLAIYNIHITYINKGILTLLIIINIITYSLLQQKQETKT